MYTCIFITRECDLYNKIPHACVKFNESENSHYVGFIKADVTNGNYSQTRRD